ncbi:hypothetical protein ART_3419 [Arthrobacter sp. PAMC 25486]|nr:hypothetical protein ART_3419 [Arthrobacter sp. PAMC 25486]
MAKADIGPVNSTVLDERADLEFLAQRKGLAGHAAIQFYVFDRGALREVHIVALGDAGLSRAWGGVKNTLSLSKSTQWAEQVRDALN